MTKTEQRRLRRERCDAKYAARSFAEEVRATESGHNGTSGVAYAIGGGLINVPATRARCDFWRPESRKRNAPKTPTESRTTSDALAVILTP